MAASILDRQSDCNGNGHSHMYGAKLKDGWLEKSYDHFISATRRLPMNNPIGACC